MFAISFIAFTFWCDVNGTSQLFKAKYDWDEKQWSAEGSNPAPGDSSCNLDGWSTALNGVSKITDVSPKTFEKDGKTEASEITVTLATSCTFEGGLAAIKGGPDGCGDDYDSAGNVATFYANAQ